MRKLIVAAALMASVPAGLAAQQSITPSEKAQGAQTHPALMAEFGGAYQGTPSAYVRRVGQRIAVQSGLSNAQSDFTVTLLDSSVSNAFAVPGGYVYVTRQLVALMNDEAELAAVMGHEVGHVAARHSRSRSRTSAATGLAAGLLGALVGNSGLGALVGRGANALAQIVTLGFSRQQELQADDLGVTYLARAGYDPLASSSILASLAAQTALDARIAGRGSGRIPTWVSTHPDPGSRVQRAVQQARGTGREGGERNRDAFLAAIDGMIYGDDPKQGIVDGNIFRHPVLRLTFAAPGGYTVTNATDAVTIAGQGGQAQFAGGSATGDLDSYVEGVLARAAGQQGRVEADTRGGSVGGLETASVVVRANSQAGPVDIGVIAYRWDANTVYHFLTQAPAGSGFGAFAPMTQSLRRMSVAEAGAVRARRVDVVTVRPGDTQAKLAARMGYADLKLERFQVLNALAPGAALRPGSKVKLIVAG